MKCGFMSYANNCILHNATDFTWHPKDVEQVKETLYIWNSSFTIYQLEMCQCVKKKKGLLWGANECRGQLLNQEVHGFGKNEAKWNKECKSDRSRWRTWSALGCLGEKAVVSFFNTILESGRMSKEKRKSVLVQILKNRAMCRNVVWITPKEDSDGDGQVNRSG